MSHTAEPWAISPEPEPMGVHGGDGQRVADVEDMEDREDDENEANARRICACVNACAGIPTEALEAGVLADLLAWCDRAVSPMTGAQREEHSWALSAIWDRMGRG